MVSEYVGENGFDKRVNKTKYAVILGLFVAEGTRKSLVDETWGYEKTTVRDREFDCLV